MAIGARSQSARTYLEKHLDEFKTVNLNELVKHGLLALRECLPNDMELSNKNVSVAVVGKGTPFTLYDDESVDQWLTLVPEEDRKSRKSKDQKMDEAGPSDDAPPPPAPQDPQSAVSEEMSVD
jgi:20S proteasome subunit alpha 6